MDRQLRRFLEQRVVTITDVDMTNMFVSARDQYGMMLQVSMHLTDGGITTIPAKDEIWVVDRSGNEWFLDKKADSTVTELSPGDKRIDTAGDLYLDASSIFVNGTSLSFPIPISQLAGYPADATKYLAGDATWKVLPPVAATPVTTVAGLPASPVDGALAKIRLGDNTVINLTYDSTLTKWVSPQQHVQWSGGWSTGNINGSGYVNAPVQGSYSEAWQWRYYNTAGLKPQIRLIGGRGDWGDPGVFLGADFRPVFWTIDAGQTDYNRVQVTTYPQTSLGGPSTVNSWFYIPSTVAGANTWWDLPATTLRDMITCGWAVQLRGNFQPSGNFYHIAFGFRWTS